MEKRLQRMLQSIRRDKGIAIIPAYSGPALNPEALTYPQGECCGKFSRIVIRLETQDHTRSGAVVARRTSSSVGREFESLLRNGTHGL